MKIPSINKQLFTDEQLALLDTAEQHCSDCEAHLASLAALGITFDDKMAANESRRASIKRVREIHNAYMNSAN